jgi:transcriptional regulator with XRE-family HTH domain
MIRKELTITEILGKNLKSLRQYYGLKQQQLAGVLGITFQQYQKYEKATSTIDLIKLEKLSQFYHRTFNELLTDLVNPKDFFDLNKDCPALLLKHTGQNSSDVYTENEAND